MPLEFVSRRSFVHCMPPLGDLYNALRAEAKGYANAAVHLSVQLPTAAVNIELAAKIAAAANAGLSLDAGRIAGTAQVAAMLALIARLKAAFALLTAAISTSVGLYSYAGPLSGMGAACSASGAFPTNQAGYAVVVAGGADAGVAFGRMLPALSFTSGAFRSLLTGTLGVVIPVLPLLAADLAAKIPFYVEAAFQLGVTLPSIGYALGVAIAAAASFSAALALSPPSIAANAQAAWYLGLAVAINVMLAYFVDASVGLYEYQGDLAQLSASLSQMPTLAGDGYAFVLAGGAEIASGLKPLFGLP